jgi:GTPase
MEFEADIYLLFHSTYICKGFQTVIHVGNVRQTATIIKMNKVRYKPSPNNCQ